MKQGKKIRAGIIGGAGYTGGELIRLLLQHPESEISFIHSRSNAGKPVASIHQDLVGETELEFTAEYSNDIDVLNFKSRMGVMISIPGIMMLKIISNLTWSFPAPVLPCATAVALRLIT